MTLRFTVAVIVRDDRAGLEALLASLLKQTRPPDELVVVDGHSTDGTFELAQDVARLAPFPVRAVREAGPRGVARTRCLELATGDVVAFADSDCVLEPDWLARYERLWAEASAGDPRPLAALGGGGVTPPGSSPLQLAIDDVMGPAEARSFHGVNTMNACYHREAALAAGGFDARLHTAEDPDLNARLARRGHRLLRVDNPVWHRRRGSWSALVRQHYAYGKGAKALLARYPEYFPWYEAWVAPAGAAASLALLALGLLVHPAFLALLALLVVATPFVVHRGFVRAFLRDHGPSAALLRRLGVLWVAFAIYQAGLLSARLGRA
ncbi:MAG TPA: glycosyltransferase [Candidatus Thermoplasmatota archaeon]|nr:glycosyltransferase [Candidatus Thermoplasmatota archaeon]